MVLVSHSYLLPTGAEPTPAAFRDNAYPWGRLGVAVFFVISGYLICNSWLADPRPARFIEKRVRRIWPGLLTMIAVTVLIVGPLMTASDHFFSDPSTYTYALRNALVFDYQDWLPGVFSGHPEHATNGVLWTLGLEVLCYALLLAAGLAGILGRRRWLVVAVAIGCGLGGWAWFHETLIAHGAVVRGSARLSLLAYFFGGAAFRLFDVRPGWRSAAIAVVAMAVASALKLPLSILTIPAVLLVVVWLGRQPWRSARRLTRLGDPSYGMYIYGWTIQQLLIEEGLGDAPRPVFIGASIALAAMTGYASWHLIERRALTHRRAPTDTPALAAMPSPQ